MKIRNLFAAILAVSLLAIGSAKAGLQAQIDNSTNMLPVLTTNVYALYGDITGQFTNGYSFFSLSGNTYTTNGVFVSAGSSGTPNAFIDCSKTTSGTLEVGGYFANTASGASNIVFSIYGTADEHLWQLYTNINVVVPALTTNWQFSTFSVGNGGNNNSLYAAYDMRAVQNTNAASVTMFTNGVTGAQSSLFFKGWTRTGF
jgi:hypothetical protein